MSNLYIFIENKRSSHLVRILQMLDTCACRAQYKLREDKKCRLVFLLLSRYMYKKYRKVDIFVEDEIGRFKSRFLFSSFFKYILDIYRIGAYDIILSKFDAFQYNQIINEFIL